MNKAESYLYSDTHEWVEPEGEVRAVGITDHAQHQLGDIVFVELPEVGKEVKQGEEMAVVESPKAAAEIMAPLSGTITEVNENLESEPESINGEPYGRGWIVRIRPSDAAGEAGKLMSYEKYREFAEG